MKNSIIIIGMLLLLAGCNSGSVAVYSEVEYSHHDYHQPALFSFDISDTADTYSGDYVEPFLELDPYDNNGEFELFWEVDSNDDYIVEYRISQSPSLTDSKLIGEDYCGRDFDCDRTGMQFCQYRPDFSVRCDSYGGSQERIIHIDELLDTVPQTLYIALAVCDVHHHNACDAQYLPVLMR